MLQKVYIIILNYNNYDDTIECLESVFRINYGNYQVIVIDNASTNDSMANILSWTEGNSHFTPVKENRVLAQWTKHLTKPVKFTFLTEKDLVTKNYGASIHESQAIFIESSHNGGFAAGNNIGIRLARDLNPDADIWLLNNDTVIVPDALQQLVEYAGICRENNDRVGIIGGKLRYYDAPNILQGVCGCYQRWSGMSYPIGGSEIDHGQYDCFQPTQQNFIFGSAMYVMKEFMDDVGLMEEDYFLYFEELDWTIRGMRLNWSIAFCPQALIYHKEGRSIGSHILLSQRSELADYFGIANRIKITKRYFPIFLPTVMAGLGVTFFRRILSGQWRRACKTLPMAIWKGLFT